MARELLARTTLGGCVALLGLVAGGCGTTAGHDASSGADRAVGESAAATLENCELGEDVSFAVAEGEGYDSPDAALEGMRGDLRLPAGQLVVAEAETHRHVWEIVNDGGEVLARVHASRAEADEWWLSHAEWCYR